LGGRLPGPSQVIQWWGRAGTYRCTKFETFYRRFYFRRRKIASLLGEMLKSPEMMRRRLREGIEFFQFLREREMAS
jgi:hypothetical protein